MGYYQLGINVQIVIYCQMLKQILKSGAIHIAAKFGPHTRKHSSPQLLILTYHRVLPDSDERVIFEEPGMIVTPDTLRENLKTLAGYFEFIKLADWLDRKKHNKALPELACAVTFDDGWRDNYEFAFPILEQLNIPATIFIVTGMIDSIKSFWPERLSRIAHAVSQQHPELWSEPQFSWLHGAKTDFTFSEIPPTREQISRIIDHAKQIPDTEIHDKLDRIEKSMNLSKQPQAPALLSWEQIRSMTHSGLIDIGSHTCNHIRLNYNTDEDIAYHEIVESKNQIKEFTGSSPKLFCFPNGDFSSNALNLVKENYIGAVTTERGWNTKSSDDFMLQRISMHDDIAKNKTSFLAKISGWI